MIIHVYFSHEGSSRLVSGEDARWRAGSFGARMVDVGPIEHALRELLCAISCVYLRQIYEFQKTSDCIRIENLIVTDMSDMHELMRE